MVSSNEKPFYFKKRSVASRLIEKTLVFCFSGNDDGLFAINPSTGDITMLRSADVLGEVNLLVMVRGKTNFYLFWNCQNESFDFTFRLPKAAQKNNVDQFATTQVVISVQVKSLHVPQFQKPLYEGLITSMGSVAVDQDKKALQILATDEDYAGVQVKLTAFQNKSH